MSLLWSRSSRGIRWSVATAQRAREIALAGSDMLMRARVAGRSPDVIRNVGACCVRLELLGTKLQPGGWTVGLRAPQARNDGFVAAIGGAPGDHRRGILDALVMARHCEGGDQVTFLGEDALERWLPLGAVVEISPIWQETDFFDLHRQFRAIDTDGSGEIDAAEVGQLLRRVLGEEPSEEQVAEVLSAADRDGSGTIDYGEFCERAFFEARLSARLHELSERAAERLRVLHAGEPWKGALTAAEGSFAALVGGTGLEDGCGEASEGAAGRGGDG